jgi:hypothetical protein
MNLAKFSSFWGERGKISLSKKAIASFSLATLSIGLTLGSASVSQATTWTVQNNNTGGGPATFIPGQSFTPNILGNAGSGTSRSPASLSNFSFFYPNPSSVSGSLFIYSNPYTGTVANLGTGSGFIGSSSSVSNGVWSFGSGLFLGSNTNTYYVYANQFITLLGDFGDRYAGGVSSLANDLSASFGVFTNGEIAFTATLSSPDQPPSVPEPSSILGILSLGVLGIGAIVKGKS